MANNDIYVRLPMSQTERAIATLNLAYDFWRDCALNDLFYARTLRNTRRLALMFDIAIFLGSSGSGISGWAVMQDHPGASAIWATFTAGAVILAGIRPLLHFENRIAQSSALYSAFHELAVSMDGIARDIQVSQGITKEIDKKIARLRRRYNTLSAQETATPSESLVRYLQKSVNERIPADILWYPEVNRSLDNLTEGT
jgi:hypothetical protein